MKPVKFDDIKDFKLGDLVYLESKFTGDKFYTTTDNCNHIILNCQQNQKNKFQDRHFEIQSFNVITNAKVEFKVNEYDYCSIQKLKFYLIG